jgi:hypothetical protein
MFPTIVELLAPFAGFYISANKNKTAIVRSFAIEQEVFGLEVVVGDSDVEVDNHGGCISEVYTTKIYLTQHEGGKYSIYEAVEALKVVGWQMSVYWVTVSKQNNLKRAVVSIKSNCVC